MTRSKTTIAFGVMLALAAAFYAGASWSGSGSVDHPVAAKDTNLGDVAVADAEAAVADAQRDFDRAMTDLYSPAPSRRQVLNAEVQRSERHAVETTELMCQQYGQQCEFARLVRRQYQETYGQ